jgi:hypothetical protein
LAPSKGRAGFDQPLGCFAQSVERALQIYGDQAVKHRLIRSGDARQRHDSGVVDQDAGAAELLFSSVKHACYLDWFADIGLHGYRAPSIGFDFLDERRSFRFAAA